jgi:hypothetical protein
MKTFRFKTVGSRVHRAYRYKKVHVPESVAIQRALHEWWKERLKAGSQLSSWDQYRPSYDYRGDGDWKYAVAVDAMYHDFLWSVYVVSLSQRRFMRGMREILGPTRIKTRPGRMETGKKKLFLRPRRRFYWFYAKKYYIERMENENKSSYY